MRRAESVEAAVDVLLEAVEHHPEVAVVSLCRKRFPFEWRFTRGDLDKLIRRLDPISVMVA